MHINNDPSSRFIRVTASLLLKMNLADTAVLCENITDLVSRQLFPGLHSSFPSVMCHPLQAHSFGCVVRTLWLTDWLSCGFMSHSAQNRSFRRRLPKPVSFSGMKKTQPNTTNVRIHQPKKSTTTHTHTHPFNGPLSGTTQVSRYQKGKTNLEILKQEIVSSRGISWATCKSASHSRQITMPARHHSVFYRPDALPATQPTASKHWRNNT